MRHLHGPVQSFPVFPVDSPNCTPSTIPEIPTFLLWPRPSLQACLHASFQLAGCLLGACCHRNQAQKDAAGLRKERCTHVQSPTNPMSLPPPREQRKNTLLSLPPTRLSPWRLPWAPCTLTTGHLGVRPGSHSPYRPGLLSDTSASTQYSEEEGKPWTKKHP